MNEKAHISVTQETLHSLAGTEREWRCFHCDEVFTDQDAAADHFGVQIDDMADEVACKLSANDGLIIKMLREAQEELRRYHQEDNESYRTFYALGVEHETKMRRVEEEGYVRGLKDYQKLETAAFAALADMIEVANALKSVGIVSNLLERATFTLREVLNAQLPVQESQ